MEQFPGIKFRNDARPLGEQLKASQCQIGSLAVFSVAPALFISRRDFVAISCQLTYVFHMIFSDLRQVDHQVRLG